MAMPDERRSPSAGWRAVCAEFGVEPEGRRERTGRRSFRQPNDDVSESTVANEVEDRPGITAFGPDPEAETVPPRRS